METPVVVYWGFMEIMENKMETTTVYWVRIGIMEKSMETTRVFNIFPTESARRRLSKGLGWTS